MKVWVAAAALLVAASPAAARDYCATRPSLGQSACVLDPGRAAIETALVDWERDRADGERTDRFLFADTLFRLGLTDRVEAQVAWSPLGTERFSGARGRTRSGDVALGARINLHNPDGKGFAYGLQPSVTLPVGRRPIGDGTWSAALVAPVTYDLSDDWNLQLSPQVAAAANEDGRGRHLAYGGILGLERQLGDTLSIVGEVEWRREDEPGDRRTERLAALALAWRASPDLVLDVGGAVALDRDAADCRVYAGVSRRLP